MEQNIDLIDLFRALNAEGTEYLVVGAYAFAFHARPRATKAAARPNDLADVAYLESETMNLGESGGG